MQQCISGVLWRWAAVQPKGESATAHASSLPRAHGVVGLWGYRPHFFVAFTCVQRKGLSVAAALPADAAAAVLQLLLQLQQGRSQTSLQLSEGAPDNN